MGALPRWPRAARLGGRTLLGGQFVDYGSRLPWGSAGSTAGPHGPCLGEELLGSYSYGFCGVQQLCHLSVPLLWGFTAWCAQRGAHAAGKGSHARGKMDVGASLPGWSSLSIFLPVCIGAASLWKCVQLPGVGFPAAVPGRAARCWVRLPGGRWHESQALRGLAVTLCVEQGKGRQFFIRRSVLCVLPSSQKARLAV